ncbi:DUF2089 family protein [Liquorilactobacillus uvarum]|uniref:DUF2089 domain-containing protein n=1 Tax=Liquorilactobacillus uvarum DSM 19971 TaxID=1423812 RepID=A0A0R1PVX3_9LACO|nr:DUF2089 family protein [Liquorilactobacillus uvarum]KRL36657.1 hypothetical protein FD20_GL001120 [Liquorilactobacillus uvarum DSM 19971]
MDWFITLEPEDQEFIKQLVMASGSLKQLAKIYAVSYPTVRLRLNKIIQKIGLHDQQGDDVFVTKVMQMVIDEKVSLAIAKELIQVYKEEKKKNA